MPITLRIERLVLDGVTLTPSQRTALAAALQTELSGLLRHGLGPELTGGTAVPSTRAPAVRFETPLNPAAAGTAIARAVYASLAGVPLPDRSTR